MVSITKLAVMWLCNKYVDDMKGFLTEFSIWIGCVLGILIIFDWLLTDRQKNNIEKRAENIWVWLATQSFNKYMGFVLNRKFQLVGVVLTCYITLLLIVIFPIVFDDDINLFSIFSGRYSQMAYETKSNIYILIYDSIIVIISTILIYKKVLNRLINWFIEKKSYFNYFLRLVICLTLCVSASILFIIIVKLVLLPFISIFGIENYFVWSENFTVLLHIPIFLIIIFVECLLVISLSWIIVYAPILIMTFKLLEFLLFRVIENNKGIILGVSGLLIGIGAVLKAINA